MSGSWANGRIETVLAAVVLVVTIALFARFYSADVSPMAPGHTPEPVPATTVNAH